MPLIYPCALPDGALLARYQRAGAYSDCYATDLPYGVSHAQYVTAFYTTWVFQLERLILKWVAARPSTDAQAAQLGQGTIDVFAAWRVEQRAKDQILLGDLSGRTKSWLMVAAVGTDGGGATRLYFGSAVVPVLDTRTGKLELGRGFRLLLGFHKRYSEVLLSAARKRILRANPA